jgi:hypothetical protein
MTMAGIELSQSLAIVAEYTRDNRQSTMTMLHFIGSAEPNIKLSTRSNASIAANTIDH